MLLAYENEAIAAQNAGEELDYVIPDSTLLIETPIAVTNEADDNAQAFVDYQFSDEGQQLWAERAIAPSIESVATRERGHLPGPA